MSDSQIEIWTTAEHLERNEPNWVDLFARCPCAPPFMHPGWQRTWWEFFGSAELHCVALRRAGRLAGLAACFRYDEHLVFIGNGPTDQQDILAEDEAATQLLVEELRRYRLDLQEIPATSPLIPAFRNEPNSVSPVLDLSLPLPRNVRRNMKVARRDLDATGTVRVVHSTKPEFLEELFRLHRARWEASGESGVLNEPKVQDFHRAASSRLAHAGMLRMHAILRNEAAVGVVYAFHRNGTVYSYLGGFEPTLRDYSPGALAIEAAIRYATNAGDRYYDFLRGAEPYKYTWGAVDRQQFRIYTDQCNQ